MLIHWVSSSVELHLEPITHIFAAHIKLYVFTSSFLAVISEKQTTPSLQPGVGGRNIRFAGSTLAYKILGLPVFSSHLQLKQPFTRDRLTHNFLSLSNKEVNYMPHRFYVCQFFFLFISSLSSSLEISFFYNLPYGVTRLP